MEQQAATQRIWSFVGIRIARDSNKDCQAKRDLALIIYIFLDLVFDET